MELSNKQNKLVFTCGSEYDVVLIGEDVETAEIEVTIDGVIYPVKLYRVLEKVSAGITKKEAIELLTPCNS